MVTQLDLIIIGCQVGKLYLKKRTFVSPLDYLYR